MVYVKTLALGAAMWGGMIFCIWAVMTVFAR